MNLRPATLARYDSGHYQPPTAADVRKLLASQRWTGSQAGEIAGVDSRTVRRWTGGDFQIPYAAWRLLLQDAGLVEK